MSRYAVVLGSQSGHCCFDATVIDTTLPLIVGGQPVQGKFESVCECLDEMDAHIVCTALNATYPPAKAIN